MLKTLQSKITGDDFSNVEITDRTGSTKIKLDPANAQHRAIAAAFEAKMVRENHPHLAHFLSCPDWKLSPLSTNKLTQ